MKVFIRSLSLEDVLFDDPKTPIDLSECNDNDGRYAQAIEKWRKQGRELQQQIKEMKNDIDQIK